MNPDDVSRALMVTSDAYLRDASSEHQSERGRWDASFEAGYIALLTILSSVERDVDDHPNETVLMLASNRLGVEAEQGLRLLRMRYSAEQARSFEEVSSWTTLVRSTVRRA
jgi:hypothetical protein